jgi:homoserine O-acetyltransferase
MDSHHVGRHAGSAAEALARITAKAIVIGLRSDLLFPLVEQEWLAAHIAGASLSVIESMYGHDGFLLEAEAIGKAVQHFLPADSVLRAN